MDKLTSRILQLKENINHCKIIKGREKEELEKLKQEMEEDFNCKNTQEAILESRRLAKRKEEKKKEQLEKIEEMESKYNAR